MMEGIQELQCVLVPPAQHKSSALHVYLPLPASRLRLDSGLIACFACTVSCLPKGEMIIIGGMGHDEEAAYIISSLRKEGEERWRRQNFNLCKKGNVLMMHVCTSQCRWSRQN